MTETKHTPTDAEQTAAEIAYIRSSLAQARKIGIEAIKERNRLRNSHSALVAALESFANKADAYDGLPEPKYFGDTDFATRYPDSTKATVTVGELRRARAALSAEGEKDAPKDELSTLNSQEA